MNHFSDVKAELWAGLLCFLVASCSGSAGPKTDSPYEALPAYAICRLGSTQFLLNRGETDCLTYSADGKYLASAGFESYGAVPPEVCVWEVATGKNVTPQGLRGIEPTGISWAPEGARFITSRNVQPGVLGLNVWTIGDAKPVSLKNATLSCFSVVWSPLGDCIAACLQDSNDVVLLDLQGKELRRVPFVGTKGVIRCSHVIEFTPDGQELIVVARGNACFYKVTTGAMTRQIALPDDERVWAIRHFPKSETLAISMKNGIRIHHYTKPDAKVVVLGNKCPVSVEVSPDERWLATAGFDGSVLWDLTTGTASIGQLSEHCMGVAFAPDGSELAVGTERISFLQTGTWQNVRNADEHHGQLTSGVMSGNHFWSGEVGPTLREWDYERGIGLRSLQRKKGTTVALAKIDDQRIAIAGGIPEIEIRNLSDEKTLFTLLGHVEATTSIVYSEKHRRLISTGRDGKLRAWGIESQALVFEESISENPEAMTWPDLFVSPDGETFACVDSMISGVQLYSVGTGKRLWKASTGERQAIFLPVAFTPDSQQIACLVEHVDRIAGTLSFSVRILNTKSGEEISRLNCNVVSIYSICISPDGRFAALCIGQLNDQREIQIWSLESCTLVASFSGFQRFARAASFSPDGEKLITLSTDTTGLVWDVKRAIRDGVGK
jgi:WD40 repeat protein